jgi:hypothetical protein
MKSKVPQRLGRLLGEYERLTRNEGAALRTEDFTTLAEIQSFKPALLVQIVEEGTSLGLTRRVVWFNECLVALAELERENVNTAAQVLRQLALQRENLDGARKRLRGLGHAYRRVGVHSSRLFARS